jgi:hypothetical protein
LKVNFSKSALVSVGPLDNVGQLVGLLGCRSGEVPLKYLGLPLGASFKLKLCGRVGGLDVAAVGPLEKVVSF